MSHLCTYFPCPFQASSSNISAGEIFDSLFFDAAGDVLSGGGAGIGITPLDSNGVSGGGAVMNVSSTAATEAEDVRHIQRPL